MHQSKWIWIFIPSMLIFSSCVTYGEVKREDDTSAQITALQALVANNAQSIDELKAENEKLKGEIEKINYTLKQHEDTLKKPAPENTLAAKTETTEATASAPVVAAAVPQELDIDTKYKEARQLHEGKKYDEAEKYYLSMVGSPSVWYDERVRYFLGTLYYDKENYKQSVITLQEFIDKYPRSKNVSAAMYLQSESFIKMGQKKEAVVFLKDLISRFPKSKEAAQAKKRLKEI